MRSYSLILVAVTILSLVVAGLSEIRTSLMLTVGLMNLSMWTLPIVMKWKKQRDAVSVEGEKHLRVGNYPEAEQSLTIALEEAGRRQSSAKKRAAILLNLAEAQRKQGKFSLAEQSIRQAMALISELVGTG